LDPVYSSKPRWNDIRPVRDNTTGILNHTMKPIWGKIKKLVNSGGMKGKIVRGGGALALGSLTENALRFVRNIILVRILAPEAFGIMAILMVSVQALEAFTEVGLRQSLIQNKNGSQPDFMNITWFLSLARGLMLYSIAFVAAPFIADFYNKTELTAFLRVGFLVIFLHGFMSPRIYVLEKELRFKEWTILIQGSAIIGIMVTVACAFVFKNVWALLAGFICEAALKVLFSFILYPIKPNLQFDKTYLRDITKFSRGMFGLPIIKMLYYQIGIFVIGKVTSIDHLGIYTMTGNLAQVAGFAITKIIEPILFPVLASIKHNKADFSKVFNKTIKTIAIFAFPFTAMLSIFAHPILHLVYGPKYSEFWIVFSILSFYSLLALFFSLLSQVFFAIGQPERHRTASLVRTVLFILMIYPAAKYFGLTGAALAVSISTGTALIIQIINIRKVMHFSLTEFMKSAFTGFMISLIVIIPGMIFIMLIKDFIILKVCIAALLCLIAWYFSFRNLGMLRHNIPVLNKINKAINKTKFYRPNK
jgi:PST family polysaccharide transporter/lipopolysaccharide exporter